MYTNRNIFWNINATLGASLRSASWVYRYYGPSSIFSFGGHILNQSRPRSISYAFRVFLFFQHIFNIQRFMSDEIIFINKLFGSFMAKIFALVFNSVMYKGYRMFINFVFCFRETPLYLCKGVLFFFEKSWLVYFGIIRALDIRYQAKIYSCNLSGFWKRFWFFDDAGKIHIPFSSRSPFNCASFYGSTNRSVENNRNSVYFREVNSVRVKSESGLRVSERVVPALSFEPRESGIFSRLTSTPEGFESKIHSDLSVLEYLRIHVTQLRFVGFPFGEFISCVIKRYRLFFNFPSALSECKSFIIDPPSLLQDVIHLGNLEFGGV